MARSLDVVDGQMLQLHPRISLLAIFSFSLSGKTGISKSPSKRPCN